MTPEHEENGDLETDETEVLQEGDGQERLEVDDTVDLPLSQRTRDAIIEDVPPEDEQTKD